MKRICAVCVIACILTAGAVAQQPRFRAPLGIERVLTGTVLRHPRQGENSSQAKFVLKSGDTTYALHGHEKELKNFVGKQVRITGHVVGSDVTISTIEPDKN